MADGAVSPEKPLTDLNEHHQLITIMHGLTPVVDDVRALPANVLPATAQPIIEPTGRFGRLFPNLEPFLPDVEKLIALGKQSGPMDAGSDQMNLKLNPNIPAGFTYLGQFLDHNITFDASSSLDQPNDPQATTNFRSGRLDLVHVYGLGPETQAFVYYNNAQQEVGKFWIDPKRAYDVPRSEQIYPGDRMGETRRGIAIIADPRNDNTVITIQLHLLMMKFHNAIINWLKGQQDVSVVDLYRKARRLAVWHYQWIVLHEWLPKILKKEVYDDIKANGLKYYHWTDKPFIPVEFNDAAYRLHPLVLEDYQLNSHKRGKLFHFRTPFDYLEPDLEIDWAYFFDFGEQDGQGKAKVQYAKRFEAKIVDTFLNMPGPIDNPLNWPFAVPEQSKPDLRSIAVRNLLRGRAFGLPSGEAVAHRMGYTSLTPDQMPELTRVGLKHAPLWYYVLKEAEVQTNGATLGDAGSRIVGEVFMGLLQGDATSYLNIYPHWKPDLPRKDGGSTDDFTMVDLIDFVRKFS